MIEEYSDFALQLLEVAIPILRINYESLVKAAQNIDDELIWKGKEIVTKGELIAELAMRELVKNHYPNHDIAGEELGYEINGSDFLWAFDPIDGTAAMVESAINYAKTLSPNVEDAPYFGITIALLYKNIPILGVVHDLLNKKTWIGGENLPTTINGIETTSIIEKKLKDAIICCTAPQIMFSNDAQKTSFNSIACKAKNIYTNRNCIGFMQLLTGEVNVVWEGDLAFHDVAALIPILNKSGIYTTDENGNNLTFCFECMKKEYRIIASAPKLHAEIIANISHNYTENKSKTTSDNQYYNKKF